MKNNNTRSRSLARIMYAIVTALPCSLIAGTLASSDYDGDGTSDPAVYHPTAGAWYLLKSQDAPVVAQNWGWQEAVPVPGDYDGDGKTDIAVHHQASGNWYIINSRSGAGQTIWWGLPDSIPVQGDFNGDGESDITVYHPEGGNWYSLSSGDDPWWLQNWGWKEARPVPADYDGDGKTDIAVFFPENGTWYILYSGGGSRTVNWGWYETVPMPADYDGDGLADLAVYHPPSGFWYIFRSSVGTMLRIYWGAEGAIPAKGDYDGNGTDDLAVFHPTSGNWFIYYVDRKTFSIQNWGWFEAVASENTQWQFYDQSPPPPPDSGGGNGGDATIDFDTVEWLHSDVSDWRQTAKLEVRLDGSKIILDYDKADVWPGVTHHGAFLNANPWIFVPKSGGGWYAATWEWLRAGQTAKSISSIAGDHIKKSPLQNFKPVSGVTYGFMVSGLARDSKRNVEERSNVVMLKWP